MYLNAAFFIDEGCIDLMKTWLYPPGVPSTRTLRVRLSNSVLYPRAFGGGAEVTIGKFE
jgi:hypothetical protein